MTWTVLWRTCCVTKSKKVNGFGLMEMRQDEVCPALRFHSGTWIRIKIRILKSWSDCWSKCWSDCWGKCWSDCWSECWAVWKLALFLDNISCLSLIYLVIVETCLTGPQGGPLSVALGYNLVALGYNLMALCHRQLVSSRHLTSPPWIPLSAQLMTTCLENNKIPYTVTITQNDLSILRWLGWSASFSHAAIKE